MLDTRNTKFLVSEYKIGLKVIPGHGNSKPFDIE